MKQLKLILALLIVLSGQIIAQDTISHIIGGCIDNEKSTLNEPSCPLGVVFSYSNDTLSIYGTIGANCCGTHLALVQTINDTVYISTIDTGDLCLCTCAFCFEIKIHASISDSIVIINSDVYNTNQPNSIDNYRNEKRVQIIPNPFVDQFLIKIENETIISLRIHDLSGQTILRIDKASSSEGFVIDSKNILPGVYLMTCIMSDHKQITKKLIKE